MDIARTFGLSVSLLLGWASTAHAGVESPPAKQPDPEAWPIEWHGLSGCPTREQAIETIRTFLGRPVPPGVWQTMSFRVELTRERDRGGQLRAAVDTRTPEGESERMLEHPTSCDSLTEGVAFMISLAIEREVERAEAHSRTPPPAEQTDRSPAPALAIAFGPEASLGWAPTPAPAIAAGGRLRLEAGPIDVAVFGGYWVPRTVEAAAPRGRARFTAWTAGATVGYAWVRGRWRAGVGAGAESGQITGSAHDLGVAFGRQRAPWAAAFATGGFALRLVEWLYLDVHAEPFVSLVRPVFAVDGAGTVYQPSAFGVRGRLGLGVRFELGASRNDAKGD